MEVRKVFVQNPWMEEIAAGRKTVEGRSGPKEKWSKYIGHNIIWFNNVEVLTKVVDVRHYNTLDEYLIAEWQKAAPHAESLEDAKNMYLNIKTKDNRYVFSPEELREGINAIEIEKI